MVDELEETMAVTNDLLIDLVFLLEEIDIALAEGVNWPRRPLRC